MTSLLLSVLDGSVCFQPQYYLSKQQRFRVPRRPRKEIDRLFKFSDLKNLANWATHTYVDSK